MLLVDCWLFAIKREGRSDRMRWRKLAAIVRDAYSAVASIFSLSPFRRENPMKAFDIDTFCALPGAYLGKFSR